MRYSYSRTERKGKDMNLKILGKDLKRKKSMNLILLLFVMLATTFIAASLNNLKVVTNGLDYYFEKAGIADFIIVSISGANGEKTGNDEKIEDFLEEQKNVTKYCVDDSLMITENQIEEIGDTKFEFVNTIALSGVDCKAQKFFDESNREITELAEGDLYIPRKMLSENFEVGDSFYIVYGDYRKKFTIKGVMKDALVGSEMIGINRILVGQKDYEELMEHGEFVSEKWYSVSCDDVEKFSKEYNNGNFNVRFGETQTTLRLTYVMDMIIAAVLLLVSICLILIAAIMLRFTIIFTVNEDYQEIGIMKAIGIPEQTIRSLYVTKYFFISVFGAAIGFFLSVPFSQMLVAEVTKNIVAEDSKNNIFMSIIVSIMVVAIVALFAFISTGKIQKFTPMDAIRSGSSGERFGKKSFLKLGNSRMRSSTFMALNDVLCEWKIYIVLLFTSAVGIWLVVMPVNTINTLGSEKISAWFGLAPCDFCITEQGKSEEVFLEGKRSSYEKYLSDVREQLEAENVAVEHVAMETVFRYKIRKDEYSFNSQALQGLGNSAGQYMYEEGTPPSEENEIAITHVVAKNIKAEIGDTVYVTMFDKEMPFVVTAIYQSMNNMGQGVRFCENTKMDYSAGIGVFGVQVTLKDTPSSGELHNTIERVKKVMPGAEVQTTKEYVAELLGNISDQLRPVKSLILTIVIIINILVVVLMQKMFLIREQSEMGMLKSVGFSDASIISWQTKRIALVLLLGVLVGTITGTPFSQLTSGQVFKMMGCSKIDFQINPWEVYVLYPAAVYVATLIACVITMLKVKRISVDSMNKEE